MNINVGLLRRGGEIRTKDVIKDALRGEDKRPEYDPGIPQSQECPGHRPGITTREREDGMKEIGDEHEMHPLVFGFFQQGVNPARISTLIKNSHV